MTPAPGNRELTAEELPGLVSGELPAVLPSGELPVVLPLEGWTTTTLHCQLDGIGPSPRHPDLVEITVAIPPAREPRMPPSLCRRCGGRSRVPDVRTRFSVYSLAPCPDCTSEGVSLCGATMVHGLYGLMHCVRGVGHYDEQAPIDPADTSTWHRNGALDERDRMRWNDQFHGAVSHSATATESDPSCAVCGPTDLERHPRRTDVERCSNCKEWLRLLNVSQ